MRALGWVLVALCAAAPLLAQEDAAALDRLVEDGRADQAALLLPAAQGVPEALAGEVRLRGAWLDGDKDAIEREMARQPGSLVALLAKQGLDRYGTPPAALPAWA